MYTPPLLRFLRWSSRIFSRLHNNLNAVHHHLETAQTETQILCSTYTSYLNPGVLEASFKAKSGVCLFCLPASFGGPIPHLRSTCGAPGKSLTCLRLLCRQLSRMADKAHAQFPTAKLVFLTGIMLTTSHGLVPLKPIMLKELPTHSLFHTIGFNWLTSPPGF